MSAFTDSIAMIFAAAVEEAFKPKLIDLLQQLHDKDAEGYQAALLGFDRGVKALQPLVAGTKTPLDDGLVAALGVIVTTSAQANGVTLP